MKTVPIALVLCTFAIAGLQTSAVLAQTVNDGGRSAAALTPPRVIGWEKVPGKRELADFEPERAQRMAQDGDSAMRCRRSATGRLTDCAVTAESPEGYGFGDAILKLVRYFKAAPSTQDALVVISVHWGWRGDRVVSAQTTPIR
jgi:hypothetical protein